MTDTIIIGAGPAGLTAAIYCIRSGLSTIVFEKNIYGGQVALSNEIENYPTIKKISGYEFANNLYEQVKELGTDVVIDEITQINNIQSRIKIIETKTKKYETRSIIIASGAKRRKLNCPGEESLLGKGVSYCATCDGSFFKDKVVCIVGGGNTALEDALYLSNICKTVYIIHRRDTFRGEQFLINSALDKNNIKVIYDSSVTKINGTKKVESICIKNLQSNEITELDTNGIFIAIGLEPDTSMFKGIINMDRNNYIESNEDCLTNIKGIFVAGDCRTKSLRQIVTATADGAVSAFQVSKYLNSFVKVHS